MRAAMLAIALALILPIGAEAGGRSSGRSHSSSGGKHHHHHHGVPRFFVGPGIYYGSPYYSPAGVPLSPPAPNDPYWYYCRAANAYYPYINSCPGGWERYLPGTP